MNNVDISKQLILPKNTTGTHIKIDEIEVNNKLSAPNITTTNITAPNITTNNITSNNTININGNIKFNKNFNASDINANNINAKNINLSGSLSASGITAKDSFTFQGSGISRQKRTTSKIPVLCW